MLWSARLGAPTAAPAAGSSPEFEAMLRSTVIGVMALGLMAGAVAAQGKMDCGKAYKGFWEKLEREKYAKISPEQLAGVSRMALRAYDACQAGDEADARALFERLERLSR
jgi:hypothetical protein